jgi:hypothetical protein
MPTGAWSGRGTASQNSTVFLVPRDRVGRYNDLVLLFLPKLGLEKARRLPEKSPGIRGDDERPRSPCVSGGYGGTTIEAAPFLGKGNRMLVLIARE